MHYLTKITFITVLFFFSVALFFLFKLPTQADAQFLCFFDDSDCPVDRICLANFCVQVNNCDAGWCNGFSRCATGFHFANHACVQDLVCDSSNVIPQNFGAVGGSVIEPCDTLNCGAQCQDNTDCTAFQNGTCSGAPACACNYPVCPSPTNLVCSRTNSTQVRGNWTQSVPVGNYLLEACPAGQPPDSPQCIKSAPPLTGGSFDDVDVDSSVWDLYARVENNTGSFCVPPSNWSGPARCPTPTPTLPPPPTDTPTPTPTPAPCQVSGRVFFDLNDDTIPQIPPELGVPSTQVVALPPIAAPYPPVSLFTNSDGTYNFTNLVCAYYDIVFLSIPPGARMSTGTTNVIGVLLPPGRSNINFGVVPFTTPTPTITGAPTPTPPPIPFGCGACGTCPIAGATWQRACVDQFDNRYCDSVGCSPPPPTPTFAPPPPPPPPPPPGACPVGTIEKTVYIASASSSCWAGGSSCSLNSQCCSNVCSGAPYFQCTAGFPPLGSMAVTHSVGNQANVFAQSCTGQRTSSSYNTGAAGGSIPVDYATTGIDTSTGCLKWTDLTHEAVFNFNGFTIPQGSRIRQAFFYANSFGSCEAGYASGKIGNVGQGGFSTAGFSGAGAFGSQRFVQTGFTPWCGRGRDWIFSCLSGGLYSGAADVTGWVQGAVGGASLTSASFLITPIIGEFGSWCDVPESVKPGEGSSFSVSAPGHLGVSYCEPAYSISGNVFVDTNNDQFKNGTETNYSLGTSNISVSTVINSCFAGNWYKPPLVTPIPQPCPRGGAGASCSADSQCCSGSCPGAPYGTCTAPPSGSSPPALFTNPIFTATGNYVTDQSLLAGQYTVCYNNLPVDYDMTFPLNGPPANFNVIVGPACSPGTSNSAVCNSPPGPGCNGWGVTCGQGGLPCCSGACTAGPYPVCTAPPTPTPTPIGGPGSIINANFGIIKRPVPPDPWFQSIGLDMRIDAGFTDIIPATAVPSHASLVGTGGTPGIIFSGRARTDFGTAGQASTINWQVGDFSLWKRDMYTASRRSVPTSYGFLSFTAQSSGIPLTNIQSPCGGSLLSCTLPAGFSHGIYLASGDLNLNSYNFTGGNYIILVDGDLTINGNITVTPGSTVVFSAKGGVNVSVNVTTIEGLYSADSNFRVEGTLLGTDSQLNIRGTAVANAALNGGAFQNFRNLGFANATTPSVRFVERPDFIVNYPEFVKQGTRLWQEVAP